MARYVIVLFLFVSSSSYSAAITQQRQLAAFFATHGITQLTSHITNYSDQLDKAISGSSQACFTDGFYPNSTPPLRSFFGHNFPLGELFQADETLCKTFAGERFYAHSEHNELFVFVSSMQKQSLNGFMEICSSCMGNRENQLYAHLQYEGSKQHFAFKKLHIVEQEKEESLSWHLSGALNFENYALSDCQIHIEQITTQQPLLLNTASLIEWNESGKSPKHYLQGELLLKLPQNEPFSLRAEEHGVWIEGQLISWKSILALGQTCLQ